MELLARRIDQQTHRPSHAAAGRLIPAEGRLTMAKDSYIHIRINSELKQAAKQHATDTGRTLAGLIDWLLRQELKKADSQEK